MVRQDTRIHDPLTSFKPLEGYTLRQRLAIRSADIGLYSVISMIGRTLRFEDPEGWTGCAREGWETFEAAYSRKPNTINAFWHNRLFLLAWHWRDIDSGIIISESFDGEYISRTAQRLGMSVIRGSSTRGGSKALRNMVKLVRDGMRMSITIDGPKGPRYKVKSGALLLAAKTGVPVLPVLAEAKDFWEVNSWDRLIVPKPFTRAKMFFGEPVFVSEKDIEGGVSAKREELQQKLDALTRRGEEWRSGN